MNKSPIHYALQSAMISLAVVANEFFSGIQKNRFDDIAAAVIFVLFFSLIGYFVGYLKSLK